LQVNENLNNSETNSKWEENIKKETNYEEEIIWDDYY
jgi:hypothetical protein